MIRLINIFKKILGCEIHIKLLQKKIFTNNKKNTFYDISIPGILPIYNININNILINFYNKTSLCFFKHSIFERKNYFSYDLPKNYQLTQNNFQNIFNIIFNNYCKKKIIIKKIHLEEDTASIINNFLKLNYSRSGDGLIELVTEPVFRSINCLTNFIKKIFFFFKSNNFSNCNLYNGDFRVDINFSILNKFNLKKTLKIEIKNLNSFKKIKESIKFEFLNSILNLEKKKKIKSSTKKFNLTTIKMRNYLTKHYNYILENDIPIISIFKNNFFLNNNNNNNVKNNIFKKLPKKKYLILLKNYFKKKKKYIFIYLYMIKNSIYKKKNFFFNFIFYIFFFKNKIKILFYKKKIIIKKMFNNNFN